MKKKKMKIFRKLYIDYSLNLYKYNLFIVYRNEKSKTES